MSRDRLITFALWSVPLIVVAGLLWSYMAPLGQKVVRLEMGETSPFLQRLLPDERVSEVLKEQGDAFVIIKDEPVYFTLTPPSGNFSQLTLELKIDPQQTPLVELGLLRDIAAQSFEFKPVANKLLEDLSWTRHALQDGLTLFAKDDRMTAEYFSAAPPDRSVVATYRANLSTPYRITNYVPLGSEQVFDVSLQGSHELLTYVKDEPFFFATTYTDLNRTTGRDDGFVKVFNEAGDLMLQEMILDDGNVTEDGSVSGRVTATLQGNEWPEGVYRVVLSGTSDIMWRSLATTQRYLVVKNRVFVGDVANYLSATQATTLYTDGKRLTFETQRAEGLQTLVVGDATVQLSTVQEKVIHEVSASGIVAITSPVSDFRVTGEGKYAFSRESFFNPDPLTINAFTNLDEANVQYVVALLPEVREESGWRTATVTFDLTGAALENGAYKFAISVPGVHEEGGQIRVHEITATLSRSPRTFPQWFADGRHFLRQLLP